MQYERGKKLAGIFGRLQSEGLEGNLDKSKYYRLIAEAQEAIHGQIPAENNTIATPVAHLELREEILDGVNYGRAVIFLTSNGCEWALRGAHGCTMCGHLARQTRRTETISADEYIKQLEQAFENIDFGQYPLLNVYNNGSFLNEKEIPAAARREILRRINSKKLIKMVVLETRPEFVTEEKVKEIRTLVPEKQIELALGLEAKDDLYRTICINKGFSLRQFDSAASIIRTELGLRTYVLLKPLFLNERESIEQAVDTIEHAFNKGATTVSLEAVTIQKYTLTNYLYDKGIYSPPWLWSIIEVITRAAKFAKSGKLIVGLFQFYPSPSTVPHNCSKCNETVMNALCTYNKTLDTRVFENCTCICKEEWNSILSETPVPFAQRLSPVRDLLLDIEDGNRAMT